LQNIAASKAVGEKLKVVAIEIISMLCLHFAGLQQKAAANFILVSLYGLWSSRNDNY
jgi:hypothetical protein